MKIDNEFTVNATVERAWALLTDVEAIAPCMPGARLTGVDGDVYSGEVRVKVGPVVAAYAGTARFVEKDEAEHRAVIDASGKASRGAGNAAATVTAQLRSEGDATVVSVETDLRITGKLAQLGGGMIRDVSGKLLGQFSEALEEKLAVEPEGVAESPESFSAGGRTVSLEAGQAPGAEEAATDGISGAQEEPASGAWASVGGSGDAQATGTVTSTGAEEAPRTDGATASAADVAAEGSKDPRTDGGATGARKFEEPGEVEPLDLVAASGKAIVRRLWPVVTVVVVIVGMVLGYVLFT